MTTEVWIPYCGAAPVPAGLLARWNLDPLLLAALAAGASAYLRFTPKDIVRRRWFALAMATLLLLFVSPFCALSSALFSARAAHHVVLTGIAAPLLVLAFGRERLRVHGGVAAWAIIHALIFWLWLAPPVYAWALSNDLAYWLMQSSLLGTAVALWSAARTACPGIGAAGLVGTMGQMTLLGALVTFAGWPMYAPHYLSTLSWGLTPLQDQQLAGLIMWVPGGALYVGAAILLFSRGLRMSGSVHRVIAPV